MMYLVWGDWVPFLILAALAGVFALLFNAGIPFSIFGHNFGSTGE